MKSILNISFFIAILGFVSCKKITDQSPYIAFDPQVAFSTPEKIEQAAIGMYDALQDREFLGGRALVYADIRGNDVNTAPFFRNVSTFNMLAGDGIALNCWAGGYRTIYGANLFTKNFNLYGAGKVSSILSKQYIAEAKFIRALSYFYLVNLYAQPYNFTGDASHLGVPLILTAADDPFSSANKVARNTVKQVYDQMIKDLTEAYPDLPTSYGNDYFDRARATKGAAEGILARVYLYKEDWDNAITMCDNVTNLGLYSLAANAYDNWTRSVYTSSANTERIFSVAMNAADNPNTNNALGQHYGASRHISISDVYLSLPNFSNADDRKSAQFIRVAGGKNYTGKYFDEKSNAWVPILRYAEILLIKAEALAQKNAAADATAIMLLNQIRGRSGATNLAPASKMALLTAIWNERRIELAFEGFGMFDFLRTKRDIPARLPDHPLQPSGSNFVIFPIPDQEIQQNPNLKQNTGYGN